MKERKPFTHWFLLAVPFLICQVIAGILGNWAIQNNHWDLWAACTCVVMFMPMIIPIWMVLMYHIITTREAQSQE